MLLSAGLALSGCGAIIDQFQAPSSSSPPAQSSSGPSQSPQPSSGGEATRTPPPRPTPHPQPTPQPPPSPPSIANPSELSGLDESAVTALLGPPADSRAQGSGRLLAWKSPQCTFDVILFMDVTDGAWRVLSWDMDTSATGTAHTPTVAACYGSVKGGR